EGFQNIDVELIPAQFPYREPYRWFGLEFGDSDPNIAEALDKVSRENDHLLYTSWYHQPFNSTQPQCGLLLDEWTEIVPTEQETSGIAFHYDRPNSEAPQTMLLVTPPQFQQSWQWNDLLDALNETLEEAKLRAVEPAQIDQTGYANFLPATISMVTRHPISMMLNYAFNNEIFTQFQATDNE
ncbi:MAG: hypothetical protein KDD63_00295, partial [Bacteroidetes bacterium]|nr:hypothetical protein [Bacteroidota bacterium]